MRAVVTVSVISLIAVLVMIHSAVSDGFTILEAPLVVMELAFVGAVYLLWRAMGGGEDVPESHHRPASPHRGAPSPRVRPSHRVPSPSAPQDGLRARIADLADWWFNGWRHPRRH